MQIQCNTINNNNKLRYNHLSENIVFGSIYKTKAAACDEFIKPQKIKTRLKKAKTNIYLALYNRIKRKLDIVDMDMINKEINALKAVSPELAKEMLDEVSHLSLNYDITKPPVITTEPLFQPMDYTGKYTEIKIGTNNRSDMKELDVETLEFRKGLSLTLPTGEMKIKKAELKHLDTPFEVQSNISEKYSKTVVWDNDKIARDLLQNFFDGHGQTLDGVKFDIKPLKNGRYNVRIEGKSTYNYREAVLMGESSSNENKKAAGNYGEGLKIVALKLLTKEGTPQVKIGSGNWNVTCDLKRDTRLDADVMNYKIEPVNDLYDGNFIEFETSDKFFVSTIVKSINRFYHSSNPHFKKPVFENDLFGIKLSDRKKQGGLYISGQRFECEEDFNNSNGVIFIKEKIPADIYDMTRDRVSVSSLSFRYIAEWLAKRTEAEECKQVLKSLEDYMYGYSPMHTMLEEFLDEIAYRIQKGDMGAIEFPENYVANVLFPSLDLDMSLIKNDYHLFPSDYNKIGMKSARELLTKSRQHLPLKPTKTEQVKIILLKKALNLLSNLKEKHFSPDELDTKIYIFDGKSKKENSINSYEYTGAEAIIKDDKCIGFWYDKSYLNETNFGNILETALHELSHKAGPDGTEEFGYKLTNVNGDVLKQIFYNPKTAVELRIISDIWSKL